MLCLPTMGFVIPHSGTCTLAAFDERLTQRRARWPRAMRHARMSPTATARQPLFRQDGRLKA